MRKEHTIGPVGQRTIFRRKESRAWLSQLLGVRCAGDDKDIVPMFQAAAAVSTSLGQCDGEEFQAVEAFFENNTARLVYQMAKGALELESTWSFCQETGVASRKDSVLYKKNVKRKARRMKHEIAVL